MSASPTSAGPHPYWRFRASRLLSAWRETDLYTALALTEVLTPCCLMVCT